MAGLASARLAARLNWALSMDCTPVVSHVAMAKASVGLVARHVVTAVRRAAAFRNSAPRRQVEAAGSAAGDDAPRDALLGASAPEDGAAGESGGEGAAVGSAGDDAALLGASAPEDGAAGEGGGEAVGEGAGLRAVGSAGDDAALLGASAPEDGAEGEGGGEGAVLPVMLGTGAGDGINKGAAPLGDVAAARSRRAGKIGIRISFPMGQWGRRPKLHELPAKYCTAQLRSQI